MLFDWAKSLCHTCVTPQEGQVYCLCQYASGISQLLSKEENLVFFALQHNVFQRSVRASNLHCESRHIPAHLQFACSSAQKTLGAFGLQCKAFNDANSLTAETYPSVPQGPLFKPTERLHTVTLCAPVKAARGTNCSPGLHFLFLSCSKLSGATTALTPYHYVTQHERWNGLS